MEKTVKLWQVALGILALGFTVVTAIVSQSKEIEGYRWQIDAIKSIQSEQGTQLKDIRQELRMMNDKQTDIMIMLQNKEDKARK